MSTDTNMSGEVNNNNNTTQQLTVKIEDGTNNNKTQRVKVKRWNAVAFWSYDVENDTCAICMYI